MKVIILAAGQGSRLKPLTDEIPKALLDVGGQTLIGRQIDAFAGAGLRDFVVITGFRPELMEKALARIAARNQVNVKTIYNPFYGVADNLASCWMAREEMRGDFIQVNGDNVFRAELAAALLDAQGAPVTVAISRKEKYDTDDMKVMVQNGRLTDIGKELPNETVDAEALGFYVFRGEGADQYRHTLEEMIREPGGLRHWFPAAINRMAKTKRAHITTLDLSAHEWCEVDYPVDLAQAREMVRKWDAERVHAPAAPRPRLVKS